MRHAKKTVFGKLKVGDCFIDLNAAPIRVIGTTAVPIYVKVDREHGVVYKSDPPLRKTFNLKDRVWYRPDLTASDELSV